MKWMRIYVHGPLLNDALERDIYDEVTRVCDEKKGKPRHLKVEVVPSFPGADVDRVDINIESERRMSLQASGFDEITVFHACAHAYSVWCEEARVNALACALSPLGGGGGS